MPVVTWGFPRPDVHENHTALDRVVTNPFSGRRTFDLKFT